MNRKQRRAAAKERGRGAAQFGLSPLAHGKLREAVGHQQAGRLAAAKRLYEEVLRIDPNQAVALNLLGMIRVQEGMAGQGLELIRKAGLDRLVAKSHLQTEFLIDRWQSELAASGFSLNSPAEAARRGSHVSLGHPDALGIDLALINDYGVLPDFRPPDNLRFGIAPLYTSFSDLERAVAALIDIVASGRHHAYTDAQPLVT